MRKLLILTLALCFAVSQAGCGKNVPEPTVPTPTVTASTAATEKHSPVMTHAEFLAAPLETPVVIETYVQAAQEWWDDTVTVYGQSEDGAYFIYDMGCSEEEAKKFVPGTKIRINGTKTIWDGEIKIADATYELLDGSYIAEPFDATALLGTDELINHMNEKVAFKGMTIEKIAYKNDEPGDDIYVTVGLDGNSYQFCVEVYLTGTDSDVYKAVGELKEGDVVDIEGFLYWYEGPNTHITSVTVAE